MSGALPAVIARGFRRAALPLVCYYAITLGLPLINGAGKAVPGFLYHALVVLVAPMVLIALLSAVCAGARSVAQSRLSPHSRAHMR